MAKQYKKMQTKHWPSWWYGPEGAAQVFHNPLEVPEGWHDHPSKVGDPKAKSVIHDYDQAVAEASGEVYEPTEEQVDEGQDDESEAETEADDETGDGEEGGKEELQSFEEMTKDQIVEKLRAIEAEFNPIWNKQKLYDLLVEKSKKD